MTASIDGVDHCLDRLNREIGGIKNRSMGGLLKGGLKIQRLSQQRVPVEKGNLRASAFTRRALDGSQAVEIGYTAAYAIYVHENMEQRLKGQPRASGIGVYWGPSGQPKFLTSAANDLMAEVLSTVASEARVP